MADNKSLGQIFLLKQQLTKMFQLSRSPHLLVLKRHDDNMEILIKLHNLVQILLLHLRSRLTHPAVVLREKDLVDNDVVDIDIELSQLLDQTFSLIHRQKLRDADSYKSSLTAVLHVIVHQF